MNEQKRAQFICTKCYSSDLIAEDANGIFCTGCGPHNKQIKRMDELYRSATAGDLERFDS